MKNKTKQNKKLAHKLDEAIMKLTFKRLYANSLCCEKKYIKTFWSGIFFFEA